ncbi:MAG: hypothetical protein UU48_C0006G0051 [Candidatus Uhrbacteria bacterium GW2011_GWF2_41_16]|uniref:Uncharacterized protein n=2 Tax=Candidatus Uhriibacteriota TaxID=1752732 RepID=A0A0G0VEA6_9BACT|nr:MAG: hypothetical protein UU35_C0007G0082 [Candidatus Uhrbacteria bacterium GW2011_GWC2_41_11]KKR98011.1 MAG: hypothetical protein UU48_C0006G0051 [Candidatus Uhrbacteria bacterium GW2011_GWF2_41_16]HBO99565.1 hypothetical protein [Candidatus Uhrbacteria bacterium]
MSVRLSREKRHPILVFVGVPHFHIIVDGENPFLITNLETGRRLLRRIVTDGSVSVDQAQAIDGEMIREGLVENLEKVFEMLAKFGSAQKNEHLPITFGTSDRRGYRYGILRIVGLHNERVDFCPIMTKIEFFNALSKEVTNGTISVQDGARAFQIAKDLPLDSEDFEKKTGENYGHIPYTNREVRNR